MDATLPPLSPDATEFRLGRFRHYKGGEYHAVGIARHSETLEELVVYRRDADATLWVRPLAMFAEDVEADGRRQPRFRFLAPDEVSA